TVVYITDNAWTGSALSNVEGTWTYTFPANVNPGTRINLTPTTAGITSVGTWDLSTSGDQIFVYQGSSANPTFIYGFSSRAWVTSSSSLNTSLLPSSLTNGKTALDFSTEIDNGYYNVSSTSGTKDFILSQIGTATKWTRNNNRYASFPTITVSVSVVTNTGEPTTQPTNFNSSSVLTWSYNVNWTAAFPACDGYLVLRSDNGAAVTGAPVDGVNYAIGDQLGNAKVTYVGGATSFNQKGGVVASSSYTYAVFSYNGTGTTRNYRQATPLTGSVITPATGEGSYYANINPNSTSFIADLQNRIRNPYTIVDYALFDETMVTNFAFTDTTAGKKVATCVYTGERVMYTPPFTWTPSTPFSREHTWCQSWMPSSSSLLPEYADQHHLFVVNQNLANAVRSNHPLGEVVNVTSSYLQGSYGSDAGGNLVYEPRESQKGNAARALLYMSLRYNGVNGLDWTFNRLNTFILPSLSEDPQDLQLLLQWHLQDPPDAEEIARNDYIHSIQGNRNPFIDRPTWTNFIDFSNLSYVSGNLSSLNNGNEVGAIQLFVSPMPFANSFETGILSDDHTAAQLRLVAYNGQVVWSRDMQLDAGMNRISVSDLEIADGLYILVVEANGRAYTQRLVKSQLR
ncbi:MAG: endonuclease, partial [Bacteroidota bacterium]